MRTAKLTYMAGLLEGEGCFSINRNTPAIIIGMTDEDIVERVCNSFSSTLRGPKRMKGSRKDVWVTSIHGSNAVGWMMTLFTLLGRRRQRRIREILSIWRKARPGSKHRTHCLRGHVFDDENTRFYRGKRHCRTCAREHMRAKRSKNNVDSPCRTDRG